MESRNEWKYKLNASPVLLAALSAVSSIIVLGYAAPIPSWATDQKVLVLEQTHREYGRISTFISSQSVKVVNHDRGFTFLASAPDWNVSLYNDSRKVMHTFLFKQWTKYGVRTALTMDDNEVYLHNRPLLEGKVRYAGVSAQQYAYLASTHAGRVKDAEYCTYTGFPAGPDALRALCAIMDLKWGNGVPLRFSRYFGQSGTFYMTPVKLGEDTLTDCLWTAKIKTVPYSSALFTLPKNYRDVNDGEIFVSAKDFEGTYQDLYGK